jgi:hypothetical protein
VSLALAMTFSVWTGDDLATESFDLATPWHHPSVADFAWRFDLANLRRNNMDE